MNNQKGIAHMKKRDLKKEALLNSVNPRPLAAALRAIIRRHNESADETEPGFTCGCTICAIAEDGLKQSGANNLTVN